MDGCFYTVQKLPTLTGEQKSVICGGNFAINKVAGPQFANANEEVVYRSAARKTQHRLG